MSGIQHRPYAVGQPPAGHRRSAIDTRSIDHVSLAVRHGNRGDRGDQATILSAGSAHEGKDLQ